MGLNILYLMKIVKPVELQAGKMGVHGEIMWKEIWCYLR